MSGNVVVFVDSSLLKLIVGRNYLYKEPSLSEALRLSSLAAKARDSHIKQLPYSLIPTETVRVLSQPVTKAPRGSGQGDSSPV